MRKWETRGKRKIEEEKKNEHGSPAHTHTRTHPFVRSMRLQGMILPRTREIFIGSWWNRSFQATGGSSLPSRAWPTFQVRPCYAAHGICYGFRQLLIRRGSPHRIDYALPSVQVNEICVFVWMCMCVDWQPWWWIRSPLRSPHRLPQSSRVQCCLSVVHRLYVSFSLAGRDILQLGS